MAGYGGFNAEFRGLENLRIRMRSRIQTLENLEPSLLAGAKELGAIEAELFATHDRGHWAAETLGTRAYKGYRGQNAMQMVASGALLSSLTNPQIMAQGPKLIRVGTKVPYAKYQQYGFTQKWYIRRMSGGVLMHRKRQEPIGQAARKVIDLSLDDRHKIQLAAALDLKARLHAV